MKKGFPKIKKEINYFLMEEEGSVSKKNVINAGLALLLMATALGASAPPAKGQYNYYSYDYGWGHASGFYGPHSSAGYHSSSVPGEHCSHGSHGSHSSHSNHGSHNSCGGWC